MGLLAAAPVFLIPLVLTPHLLFYYDITPEVVLLMLTAVAGLAALCWQLPSWTEFVRGRWSRWYLIAVACSLSITSIAALRSAERALSWYGSNWRRMGTLTEWATVIGAVWVAHWAVRSQQNLLVLLRTICAAGILASLYGIAQYLGWDPILPHDAYSVGEGVYRIVRPPGTLGHSDYFAAFLLWPVFAAWALCAMERVSEWRWLARGTAMTGSIAILLTGSRGALLGLACGVGVRLLLKRPVVERALAISLIGVVAVAGFYLSPAGERLRARVHWVEEDPVGGARLLLWRDSLRMFAKRPVTGYGPETFSAEFPKFESAALARAYPDFFHESPHNLPLDVLTSEGALGLLALLGVAGVALAGGLAARRSMAALAFLPGLAATLTAHQFAVWIAPSAFYFYLAAGVLAGAGNRPGTVPQVAALQPALVWRGAALLAGVAGALFLTIAAYRLMAQDWMLGSVERRLDAGDTSSAVRAYQAALARPAEGVTADLYLSRRWSKLAMESTGIMPKIYYSQVAAGAASRATRQPEQLANAWYNLSILTAAHNDAPGTEYALRAALSAAPNWYKPHWTLARLLANEGRPAEAGSEAALAIDLNGGKDPEVASTLAQDLRSSRLQSSVSTKRECLLCVSQP